MYPNRVFILSSIGTFTQVKNVSTFYTTGEAFSCRKQTLFLCYAQHISPLPLHISSQTHVLQITQSAYQCTTHTLSESQ